MLKYIIIGAVSLLLVFSQLALLRYLDYSSAYVEWIDVSPGEELGRPSPNFSIATIDWHVDKYAKSPKLKPLREFFRENCGDKRGIEAASCISLELIEIIPKGTPKREIFDVDYSPAKAFEKHLGGEQGFCTNYAGMTTAMLLSVGVPARFVQIRTEDGYGGHNITEVWDENEGWVLFDPFNNGLIEKNGGRLSATEAHFEESVTRVDASEPGMRRGHLPDYFEKENRLRTTLVYPEPWLYTRVGSKEAPFFRGAFVGFGQGFFRFSLAQNLLRVGILLFAGVFVASALAIGYRTFSPSKR
ncbi:MAG: transglutaminase domain-containing protein [Acidobacteria bacterium]|nr:MAG: transglutaminase domain-containing protein [Acidobacteriota bacterium]REJ99072.1 MAG: transglutaminase domain-containing protein [Acidobacteriota bacterium]REK16208.1 MAG: transglutaminase domain-containing protein [Acidobacteriota bacterium]REK43889.1 MAG: transglutaminase domain-containing protein [Acidobacteriota bacterium]